MPVVIAGLILSFLVMALFGDSALDRALLLLLDGRGLPNLGQAAALIHWCAQPLPLLALIVAGAALLLVWRRWRDALLLGGIAVAGWLLVLAARTLPAWIARLAQGPFRFPEQQGQHPRHRDEANAVDREHAADIAGEADARPAQIGGERGRHCLQRRDVDHHEKDEREGQGDRQAAAVAAIFSPADMAVPEHADDRETDGEDRHIGHRRAQLVDARRDRAVADHQQRQGEREGRVGETVQASGRAVHRRMANTPPKQPAIPAFAAPPFRSGHPQIAVPDFPHTGGYHDEN